MLSWTRTSTITKTEYEVLDSYMIDRVQNRVKSSTVAFTENPRIPILN